MARDVMLARLFRTAQHADAKGFKEFSRRMDEHGR